jgi:phospholipase/carboxylesterase
MLCANSQVPVVAARPRIAKETRLSSRLESVEVNTGDSPTASVIWLHGLGADGHDFEPIVPELSLPSAVRFVFPHAPIRAVTVNQGAAMRAWYDILSMQRTDLEDDDGIYASAASVGDLIAEEVERGVPAKRVVLAGFSQGGAIALHAALRYPEPLAGVLALSTYLPLREKLEAERSDANRAVPIMMAHGQQDTVVSERLGQGSCQYLQDRDYQVEWFTYPMAHSVCAQEIADISRWLTDRLALG